MFDRLKELLQDTAMGTVVRDEIVARKLLGLLVSFPRISDAGVAGALLGDNLEALKDRLPVPLRLLKAVAGRSPSTGAKLFSAGTSMFANRFVAGNGAEEIIETVWKYKQLGFRVNIDILAEKVIDEDAAARALKAYHGLLSLLSEILPGNEVSISLKLSSFCSQADETVPERGSRIISGRLSPLCEDVRSIGGHIFLDAEEYAFSEIYLRTLEALYGECGSTICAVLQTYLRKSPEFLDRLSCMSNPKDPMRVRLVRGAYWDHEVFEAENLGWPLPPVFTRKEDTDRNFHALFEEGWRRGFIMIPATHNVASICRCIRIARVNGFEPFWIQMLGGMAPRLAKAVLELGENVEMYLPTQFPEGDLAEALGYLVRRIVENGSQFSFLAQHRGAALRATIAEIKQISRREELWW